MMRETSWKTEKELSAMNMEDLEMLQADVEDQVAEMLDGDHYDEDLIAFAEMIAVEIERKGYMER